MLNRILRILEGAKSYIVMEIILSDLLRFFYAPSMEDTDQSDISDWEKGASTLCETIIVKLSRVTLNSKFFLGVLSKLCDNSSYIIF